MLRIRHAAVTHHDVRTAVEDRRHQHGDVRAEVLVVGIGVDDQVGAGGQRSLQPGLKRRRQPAVAFLPDDVLHAELPRDLSRPIGAAVVDHQILDLVHARQGPRQLSQGQGEGLCLVVARDLDDQFHCAFRVQAARSWVGPLQRDHYSTRASFGNLRGCLCCPAVLHCRPGQFHKHIEVMTLCQLFPISCTLPISSTDAAVALESTVISHGLPYPHNIQLALRLEEIVRAGGASPATIGIIAGKIVVGLDRGQIEHLATAQGVRKVSRRDLPIVVARKLDGATTVATTSWAAHRAGIRVFATGGIGGVHRTRTQEGVDGGQETEPESGRTAVIQHPASILHLPGHRHLRRSPRARPNAHPRRLRGGEGDPGSAGDAGMAGDARGDGRGLRHGSLPRVLQPGQRPAGGRARRYARGGRGVVPAARALGLPCGMLVTVPIPAEFEPPAEQMEAAIAQALAEAEAQGIKGKAMTPFLLARVSALTGEASLRANLALLENNARVAAEIAVAFGQGNK